MTHPATKRRLATLALAAAAAFVTPALADNWPQWRGPQNSGIVTEKIAETWPEEGPKKLWTAKTGIGYASPIAADGKVYLYYLQGDQEVLEAFDAAKGTSLWKHPSPKVKYTGAYPGTRATPVIDAGKIYTLGSDALLTARALPDGKELWALDLLQETGSKANAGRASWGNSSVPLIDGDHLFAQVREDGNAAVCVDKNTGKLVWKSDAKGGGYAPPAMATVDGKKLLLCFADKTLLALDPATGKTVWQIDEEWEVEYDINASMPIVQGNKAFLTVAYKNGKCALYELAPTGAKKLWGGKQVTGRFQPAILDDGHLYVNSEGTLKCVKWDDGKVAWETPAREKANLGMGGSLVRVEPDKLLLLSERGALTLLKATPEGYSRLAQAKGVVEGKQVWATPLVYNGKLYVKGEDELACFDIAAR